MTNLTLITMKIGKIPLVILIIFMYLEIFVFLYFFLAFSVLFDEIKPLSFLKKMNFWVYNSSESSKVIYEIMSTITMIYLKSFFIIFFVFIGYFCVLYFHNKDMLFEYMKTLKFCLIPYWIICFFIQLPLSIFLTIMGFIFMPLLGSTLSLILISYFILLFTSVPSILYLIYLKKNNLIKDQAFIINLILQFCFLFDLVSTIYLIKIHDTKKIYK
jgi:hypothetical protein